MLLPFLCLRFVEVPQPVVAYQEVWPCGQSVVPSSPEPGGVRLITPTAWIGRLRPGGVSGWPKITQSPTHSLLRTHLGRLQSPVPTAAATSRHGAPCTAPAPPFLYLMLNGTSFFFHCKSSVLLGTSWRKLRDAKKNLIISPVHFPKSLQDMQKINIKCEVCVLFSLFIKAHANVHRRITVCYPEVRPGSSFLLLVFLTKYHQQPSRRTETQWTQAS